jgi:NAD(P)-dependent dehydrogenase (short-subunit alcohol dehydrogenase family)
MTRLADKTALITGGGSGIGLAVARAFLTEGARVAITGRDHNKLLRAAEYLAGNKRLLVHPCDATDPDAVAELVAAVNASFGPIDILVNNAGMNIRERTFAELTPERWRDLVAGNLDSAFYCIYAVMPQMRQRQDGLIININSLSGRRASPLGGTAYVAAKMGMRGLALSVAAEEKGNGIRVCTVYPGEVDTPILEHRPTPVSAEHRRQILQPEDVAAGVLFVATLPARATVPELVLMPSNATFL